MAPSQLAATALAGGLQIALFGVLSLILALTRAATGVHYGNGGGGGKRDLTHLVRAQGNVAEFGPYVFAAFLLTEYNQLLAGSILFQLAVVVFFLRVGHALRLAMPGTVPLLLRLVGTLGTIGILVWLALLNISFALSQK